MEVRDDLSREMCPNISFPLGFVLILEPPYVSPMVRYLSQMIQFPSAYDAAIRAINRKARLYKLERDFREKLSFAAMLKQMSLYVSIVVNILTKEEEMWDSEDAIEYYVCLNGHVLGICTFLPLSDSEASELE
ncbi:EID1-like F-box protein 2 [Camellia lanceoleosa]|uniref:EID1-like F-box protein 2 n=1 Tax=Camellia lanceoleosa TaxID=1840588 RepID=A0ACC0GQY4_9ERIC|nr:EID1-like F-box protein 2 [Camellia lanceoleosa]